MEAGNDIAIDMGIRPGDLVSGRYRVGRVIGHGGMGVVVEATHEALDQRVAIKFLRPLERGHEEATLRFVAEARAMGRLQSIHFPRVIDIASLPDGTPYFVMEFLEGYDLGAALAVDGVVSVPTAVDYALQLCEALAEAHTAGIVHRDIKPANIFLTKALDGSTLVKVLDFGISKDTQSTDVAMTATRALMGSPRYMAPEQMRSMRKVDHRADIWSLGVVIHEALTGHPPFVGETLPEVCAAIAADDPVRVRQLRRDVPIELQDAILRCLAKVPEQRYQDVGELAHDLVPFASPDAAVTGRRATRIVRGPSRSIAPKALTENPLSLPPPDDPIAREPGPISQAPASRNLPPLPDEMAVRPRFRRWGLVIVAAVAVPAFVVGALQPSPQLAPGAPGPTASSAGPTSPSAEGQGPVRPGKPRAGNSASPPSEPLSPEPHAP